MNLPLKKIILSSFALSFCPLAFAQPTGLAMVQQTKFRADTFSIVKYGAKADGQTLNTQSINNAIDECNKKGGGVVLIPN